MPEPKKRLPRVGSERSQCLTKARGPRIEMTRSAEKNGHMSMRLCMNLLPWGGCGRDLPRAAKKKSESWTSGQPADYCTAADANAGACSVCEIVAVPVRLVVDFSEPFPPTDSGVVRRYDSPCRSGQPRSNTS